MNHLHNNIGGLVVQISSLQGEIDTLTKQKLTIYEQLRRVLNDTTLSLNDIVENNVDFYNWLKQGDLK